MTFLDQVRGALLWGAAYMYALTRLLWTTRRAAA
jgi:hypothetical protein